MSPVSTSPARNSGCATSRDRKGRLVVTPASSTAPKRAGEAVERRRAVGAVGDDLGEHRVVVRGDGIALAHAVVDAQIPGRRREREMRDGAGGGEESALGVFGVDPRLDRVPGDRQRRLPGRQRLAGRDPDLHSTRSVPVTISVTGCSTWSRVFISMNQKRSSRSPCEASAMNSTVPAPR